MYAARNVVDMDEDAFKSLVQQDRRQPPAPPTPSPAPALEGSANHSTPLVSQWGDEAPSGEAWVEESAPSSAASLNSSLSTHTARTPMRSLPLLEFTEGETHVRSLPLDPTLKPDQYVKLEMERTQLLARRGAKACAEQMAHYKALATISEGKESNMTAAIGKLKPVFSERAKREGSQVCLCKKRAECS